ncbi:MAG: hypothetical protein AB1626_03100 [Candidatus Micrarchaeota archaeon]
MRAPPGGRWIQVTLLRPRSERQITAKLAELPEEKRRVVILVGRHPGEGSTRAAEKLHRAWEKLGAAAVKIPASMTPDGFWRMARDTFDRNPRKARQLVHRLPPSDHELIEKISGEFGVPVISLHGTPHVGRSYFMTLGVAPDTRVDTDLLDLFGVTRGRIMLEKKERHHPSAVVVEHYFPATFSPLRKEAGRKAVYSVLLTHHLEGQVKKLSKANPLIQRRYDQLVTNYVVRKPGRVPDFHPVFEAAVNGLIKVLAAQQREGEFRRERK